MRKCETDLNTAWRREVNAATSHSIVAVGILTKTLSLDESHTGCSRDGADSAQLGADDTGGQCHCRPASGCGAAEGCTSVESHSSAEAAELQKKPFSPSG